MVLEPNETVSIGVWGDGKLWAGTEGAGLWLSEDGGVTWRELG